ncbi:MAG: hypothetical protein ACT4QB_06685 [Gammaproteobacteria bacterium]
MASRSRLRYRCSGGSVAAAGDGATSCWTGGVEEIRARVLAYQEECEDALWQHWTQTHPPVEDQPMPAAEALPPPEDPMAKAIDQRAWELSHESYEEFRKWMGRLRGSGVDFDPRYWKPRWMHLHAVESVEAAAARLQQLAGAVLEDARQLALSLDVEPYDRRKPDPEEGSLQAITESIERLAEARRRESP